MKPFDLVTLTICSSGANTAKEDANEEGHANSKRNTEEETKEVHDNQTGRNSASYHNEVSATYDDSDKTEAMEGHPYPANNEGHYQISNHHLKDVNKT